jgi:hypothetical protein
LENAGRRSVKNRILKEKTMTVSELCRQERKLLELAELLG